MSNLNVVFASAAGNAFNVVDMVAETKAFTNTSVQTSAAALGDRYVSVIADADCWIEFGTNPVAVAASAGAIFLAAKERLAFRINQGIKLAVIGA
jgi:hypothetical protein